MTTGPLFPDPAHIADPVTGRALCGARPPGDLPLIGARWVTRYRTRGRPVCGPCDTAAADLAPVTR